MEFKWEERYSVKIKSIDDQHKKFFQYFEKAYILYKSDSRSEGLDVLVKEIITYAAFHFEYEEKLFKKFRYPEAKEHTAHHNEIRDRLAVYKKNIADGTGVPLVDFLGFMVNWLRNHIDREDMNYSDYLRSKGVE